MAARRTRTTGRLRSGGRTARATWARCARPSPAASRVPSRANSTRASARRRTSGAATAGRRSAVGRAPGGGLAIERDGGPRRAATPRPFPRAKQGELDESFGATPNLVVVDGGKAQLGAALAAMEELDLPRVAVIALAKRKEEVFVPGLRVPISLDRTSAGLQLLQRIRDEAHRVALRLHQKRRDSKAMETIFETLAGVGPVRRRAILRHFGSVERFLDASQEELEGVPGFPQKTAREGYAQLHKTRPSSDA